MKRFFYVIMILSLAILMTACGNTDKAKENGEYEIAVITDTAEIEQGSFTEILCDEVSDFADNNGMTHNIYKPEEKSKEAYLKAIDDAVSNKCKIVIASGSELETAVFNAQTLYPDVYFLLIDGIPHDQGENYGAAANTIGVIFAEEQAGYLAGYAAVMDGYKSLGFMGGEESPHIKRYGYGFVQGAASAAAELEKKVEIAYTYTEVSEATEEAEKKAADWYSSGTEVIFSCGGNVISSVTEAAKQSSGKVIGADVDQSHLSKTVITSVQKDIDTVVEDMLENYTEGKFVGGTAFNYTAENGGVSLQIENAKFNKFNKSDYEKVFKQLKNGDIKLKKDTGVKSVKDLTGDWVTIK